MDAQAKTMAYKRDRHFGETKTIIAATLFLFGFLSCFCLVLIWPQIYAIQVFNSKAAYKLIIDVEDYFTCNEDYKKFVIDEPDSSYSMFSIYVFGVGNAADVFQRGAKPVMTETGPFGFLRHSYRYEISFDDPTRSETVSFKEFSVLLELSDVNLCEDMFYRTGRDSLLVNPCINDRCKCKDYDTLLTIVNPMFLKLQWSDSTSNLMACYSVEVFSEVKALLEDPFTEAVRAHLVSSGLKEVYSFRAQMQMGLVMNTAMSDLSSTYDLVVIAENGAGSVPSFNPLACGLKDSYRINECPFSTLYPYLSTARGSESGTDKVCYQGCPSIKMFLDVTSNTSILNMDYGLPRWLGLSWYLQEGPLPFNGDSGSTMLTRLQAEAILNDLAVALAEDQYGGGYTTAQLAACKYMTTTMAKWMAQNFYFPYVALYNNMVQQEFLTAYQPVACSPFGLKCVWQYGYLKHFEGVDIEIEPQLVTYLIDPTSSVNTNPASFYKDLFAPSWYNAFLYYRDIYSVEVQPNISCTKLGATFYDAKVFKPAALWAKASTSAAISGNSNFTKMTLDYKSSPVADQQRYFKLSCYLSHLMFDIYRSSTRFHDAYVIDYLNKHKDPLFTHNFTSDNWTDLGVAQWGAGVVTDAIASVRTTTQIVRDGMWNFGKNKYYLNMMEYSSWATVDGFPQTWIYSLEDARLLLHSLARRDALGFELRRFIVYQGTTFIGDGSYFEGSVGSAGDRTFTLEANRNSFACSGPNQQACGLLDKFFNSSGSNCAFVEELYLQCKYSYQYESNSWINVAECRRFQTIISDPTTGIICDQTRLFSQFHPYRKSRGNVVYTMLHGLTLKTVLQDGLWCNGLGGYDNCDFQLGGMFATTTVRKLLFNGYTEPSVLKYLNLKLESSSIRFECREQPYDICGEQLYDCTTPGLMLILPNNKRYVLEYEVTPSEEYFAPHFVVTEDGDMLWPLSSDSAQRQEALGRMSTEKHTVVANPFFAVYPAQNNPNETAFNKYYQCQKRLFFGPPNLFDSCFDTLYTGRDTLSKILSIKALHGNESVYEYSNGTAVQGSVANNQYEPHLWSGFNAYPYSYLGQTAGANYKSMVAPEIYNKYHAIRYKLFQKTLLFEFQRDIELSMPPPTGPTDYPSPSQSINLRRFVEDFDSWKEYRALGSPVDSFGMPHKIPIGMSSLQRFADFPVYLETPNSYGNKLWGGIEYSFLAGTFQNNEAQRTYVDYDPVTGRAMRSVLRQQINLRVESGPLFPLQFSSQSRCTVPTKTYAYSSGYGCWAYVSLYWYEEARFVDTPTFFQYYDHLYSRPERAATLITVGVIFGCIFMVAGIMLFISEDYHRKRFRARVYID